MLEHTSQALKPREDKEARMVRLPPFRVKEGDDRYGHLLAPERQPREEFQEKWGSGEDRL